MNDLAKLETDILVLNPDAPIDALLGLMNRVRAAKDQLRKIERMIEDRGIEFINARGAFRAGDILYTVGRDKRVKCTDPKSLLSTLLEATGGDLDRVADCLASDAWKSGATRQTLEEHGRSGEFDRHFNMEEVPRLKLKVINTKFIESKSH